MWKEVIEVFGAVLVSLEGFEFIKWIANRRANKRKAAAEADKEGHTGACDGVYVAYVDYEGVRRICPASEWSDSLGAAQGGDYGEDTGEDLEMRFIVQLFNIGGF